MRWMVGVVAVMMGLFQLPRLMHWGRPGLGHLAWFLGVTYCYLPALVRSRRVAITADAKGCTEWLWLGWRRTRWDEVSGVEVSDDSARIVTARGTVEFGPGLNNWLELAESARAAAGLPAAGELPDDTMRIPPEEVAGWLGIEPDEALECRSDHLERQMGLLRGFLLAEAGVMAALTLYHWSVFPSLARSTLVTLAMVCGLACLMPRPLRRSKASEQQVEAVRATADALEVQDARGRWRRFAWGSLRRLTPFGRFQVLSTPEGDVALPPRLTNADRLLGAIEQAIAARRRGLALPRMTGEGVPEGAISRASEVEVAVERGLSRPDA